MSSLHADYSDLINAPHLFPKISIYMPTHRRHPERQQDQIRFRNLVRLIEHELLDGHPESMTMALLQPLRAMADDHAFWTHVQDGLAVLRAPEEFRVYKLQRPVPEIAVVGERYLTKPLLRIMQSADRFQVLALTRNHVRLFEGDRDTIDEIDLHQAVPRTIEAALGAEITEPHMTVASFGGGGGSIRHAQVDASYDDSVDLERFYRAVDDAVYEYHSRESNLPLILAALPQHAAIFHGVSHNPLLLESIIARNPDMTDLDTLRIGAWKSIEPEYLKRLQGIVAMFEEASAKGHGTSDVIQAGKAAAVGRIATLLVDATKRIPGRIADDIGHIEFDDLHRTTHGDVLDDIGEVVLRHGGEVIVVPSERMPAQTGVAAVYRY
ncbi:MAG: hypothetical protein FGM24_05470 [Candidatus Kapabacteria bacterium]|nr:hypothetical protein [Candidatus Kapabacteria bacterium]